MFIIITLAYARSSVVLQTIPAYIMDLGLERERGRERERARAWGKEGGKRKRERDNNYEFKLIKHNMYMYN